MDEFHPWHARVAAGAGAGADDRGGARGGAWLAARDGRDRHRPTSGDRIQDRPLAEVGGKALWTKELDLALLGGETDCSVHSMKDVESERPDSAARSRRCCPAPMSATGLIGAGSLDDLPRRARWSARSSPRRAAQVRRIRPDLVMVSIRGNVDTRLAKRRRGRGRCDLARCRRARPARPRARSAARSRSTHAASAGAGRDRDRVPRRRLRALALLRAIDHAETSDAVAAERAFTLALGGTCHSPVAALALVEGETIAFRCEMFSADGVEHVADKARFAVGDLRRPRRLRATCWRARPSDPDAVRRRMKPLLILRPEPGNDATAERARALGLAPLQCPLFALQPLAWDAPDPARYDALLLTSANALRQGGEGLGAVRALDVYAVGAATAAAAREGGLRVSRPARRGRGAARPLPGELRLLHLAGPTDRADAATRSIDVIPVYRAAPIDTPPRSTARRRRRRWSTARARARGWPNWSTDARDDQDRRDQRRGGGACGDRLGAREIIDAPGRWGAAGPCRELCQERWA